MISCLKNKIDSLLLSSRCMTNYMKSCSFLHAHFFESMKVVETLLKTLMLKNSFIEKTYVVATHRNCLYGIASMRQFQCVPTTYVTENKESSYFKLEIYILPVSGPLSCLTSFKHPKVPISFKIYYKLFSYISKFEFMNYIFANLLVALF